MMKLMIRGLLIIAALTTNNAEAQENIPAQVKTIAEGKATGNKINKWIADKQRGKYIAVLSDGSVMEISMAGEWLSTSKPVPESKLPAKVAAAVSRYVGAGYEVDNYLFVQDAVEGVFYTIDITSDDDDATVFLNAEGKVLKKDVRD
ncbi:hypothetical protein JHJ32_21245 [Parapedobacter sp. ISTM3]|uniref:PepSY-like domain-containing protein n=1 Tax=Parapedobacter sp. ISTM3 TaxID=2800130 RepID=UPI001904DA4E|nr:PepSY-like domain-containing protein [Parapedobacter sp. ISTM3]MBK1442539.1 hypothetical protein [Parapedobacter sp. ISTM3]